MWKREEGLRGEINRRIQSLFTSKGESSISSASYSELRNLLIPANTFKFGQHLKFEGGGFVNCVGGNVTSVDFELRMGGINVFPAIGFTPGSPGSFFWYLQGIITQNSDIGGVFFWNDANFKLTRGELTGWSGPGADMNLVLQSRISVSAGTGFVVNETWNVVKIPNGGEV